MVRLNLKHKLTSSSLIEVVIALIILLTLFSISIYFISIVNQSGFNIQKMKAVDALSEYIYKTKANKNFFNHREEINGWQVSCEVAIYKGTDSILQLNFCVYEKDSTESMILSRTLLVDNKKEILHTRTLEN